MSKKLQYCIAILVMCLNLSCSDDDSLIEQINESFIDGKWKLTETSVDGGNVVLNNCDKRNTIEFKKSNHEVIIITYGLTVDSVCEIETDVREVYTIDNNTITVDNATEFEIIIKDDQILKLKTIKASEVIIHTYERQ